MFGRLIRKHHSQPQSPGCLTDITPRIQRLIVSSAFGTAPLSAGVTEERWMLHWSVGRSPVSKASGAAEYPVCYGDDGTRRVWRGPDGWGG